jgi:hypothetical protein
MVDAELELKSLLRAHQWWGHYAGIVDEDIDARLLCRQFGCGPNARNVGLVEWQECQVCPWGRLPDLCHGDFRLPLVATGEQDARATRRQNAGSLEAKASVRSSDDEALAPLVRHIGFGESAYFRHGGSFLLSEYALIS